VALLGQPLRASSREGFVGLSGKEKTSNRPHQPATRPRRWDLPQLRVSTMCGLGDLAPTAVVTK
jgi:hypothetical protein